MTTDQLLGPLGLTAALLIAVGFLVREGLKFIRETITDLEASLKVALDGWAAQTKVNADLVAIQDLRNRDDELRLARAGAGKVPA